MDRDGDAQYTAVSGEDGESGNRNAKEKRFHLYTSVAILNCAYIITGTTFAWSSPMLMKLHLSEADASTVASMISLGGMLGPFVSGAVLDRLGRKGTAALSATLFTGSYFLLTVGRSVLVLAAGRFLAGISYGIVFSAVPMYIAEISEDIIRGFLNTLNMVSIASGSLLMFAVGPLVSYAVIHYILLGLCFLLVLLIPLLPESPYYLTMKSQTKKAREVVIWLRENRPTHYIEQELQVIQKTISLQQKGQSGSMSELLSSPGSRRAFIIGCSLISLQQLSGITIVMFYLQEIFQMTGSVIPSSTCSIIIGVIKFGAGLMCPLTVRRFGYRKPLMVSIFGTAVGMGSLGIFFFLKCNNYDVNSLNWLPLLSLTLYILSFSSGFSNIPWALAGEMFPSNVKSMATCLITTLSAVLSFVTSKLFPNFIDLLGIDILFLVCSLLTFFALVFTAMFVVETSCLSLLQIQELFSTRKRNDVLVETLK